jgi:hypothetical protein
MLSSSHINLARVAGAAVGVAIAAALLVAARPGAAVPGLPAGVSFTLAPPGTLVAKPASPASLLDARRLEPGGNRANANFRLRNQSGRTLWIGFRGMPDSTSLDGLVRVRLVSGARVLGDTTLQGFRRGSAATVSIRPGTSRHFRIQVWIPATVTDGFQGRIVKVTLDPTASTAGARP